MKLLPKKREKLGSVPARGSSVFNDFQFEMDRLFDRFFHDSWAAPSSWTGPGNWTGWGSWTGPSGGLNPSLDVIDGEKELTVKAELPGVDPKDLDISVSGNLLVISGQKRDSREEKHSAYYRSERMFGAFERRVELPSTANSEKVHADFKDGVLTVRVEKHEGVKPKKIPLHP